MQFITQPMPLSSEVIDDRVATVLEAGTNVTIDYDDAANVLTISATPGGGGSTYTDEQAQDAVGNIVVDSATIDFLYNDAAPSISGFVKDNSITEPMLNLSDNTTKNSSTSTHGLLPKLPGGTTTFLRGDGTWIAPPTGTSYTDEQVQDVVSTMLVAGANITLSYNDSANTLTISSAASGGGAPTDAEYITSAINGALSAERVLTNTTSVTWDFSIPGQAKAVAINGGVSSTLGVLLQRSTTQSIPVSTDTALILTTEVRDDLGYWNPASPTRITIPHNGWYNVSSWLQWDANTTQVRILYMRVNGATNITIENNGTIIANQRMGSAINWYFTAGDYVELIVWQNTTGARDVVAINFSVIGVTEATGVATTDDTSRGIQFLFMGA